MIVFGVSNFLSLPSTAKLRMLYTVFPTRPSSMRASPSTRQPPTCLKHWRTLLLRLLLLELNVLKSIAMWKMVLLGLQLRTWLSSVGLLDLQEKPWCRRGSALIPSSSDTARQSPRPLAKRKRRDQKFSGTTNTQLGQYTLQANIFKLVCAALPLTRHDPLFGPS